MPNYNAYKSFLYTCKQPHSPQARTTMATASTIPQFLEKYGVLWNKEQTPQMKSEHILSPIAYTSPHVYSPQVASKPFDLIENKQLKELMDIVQ